jgi:hypothetical protein
LLCARFHFVSFFLVTVIGYEVASSQSPRQFGVKSSSISICNS